MNALQKTLTIVAFLVLANQTVRDAYLLWLEPHKSVLDQYDRPLRSQISGLAFEEIVHRYEAAHKAGDEAREKLLKDGKDENPIGNAVEQEPFKSETALHDAIAEWENKSKEIRELRSYWVAGLLFLLLGLLSYTRVNRWLGLTLLMVAFSFFIYWTSGTSDTFTFYATRQFHTLMLNKLVLSAISLLLLLVVIWHCRIFAETKEAPAQ